MFRYYCTYLILYGLSTLALGSKVILLSENNFSDFRLAHRNFLILFSVHWCTKCIRFLPEYELVAEELAKHNPPIAVTMIDGMKDPQLAQEFTVFTYPTAFSLKGDLVHRYDGKFRAKDLITFMEWEVSQIFEFVESFEELELKRKPDDAILLGLFDSMKHPKISAFRKSLNVASQTLRPFIATSYNARQAFHSTEVSYAIMILKPDQFSVQLPKSIVNVTEFYTSDNAGEIDVVNELIRAQLPLIGIYNEASKNLYDRNFDLLLCAIPYTFSVYGQPKKVLNDLASKLLDTIVKDFGEQVHWIIVDDLDHPDFMSRFADPEATDEIAAGCLWNNQTYQLYSESLNMNELKDFIRKTFTGAQLSIAHSSNENEWREN